MNCRQYEELTMKYFDRIASDSEITALKEHLGKCNRCRNQFEQLEKILGFLEQDIELEIPTEFEFNVMIKINRYENAKNSSQIRINCILYTILGFIFFIPTALAVTGFENISIYEILMGLISKMSLISDILLVVFSVIKLMNEFILENSIFSIGQQYAGLAILFTIVFISINMLIQKADNNL